MNAESSAGSPSAGLAPTNGRLSALAVAWALRVLPLTVLLAATGAVVPGLTWWLGALLGLVAGSVWFMTVLRGALDRVLVAIGAVDPADEALHARLLNLVQGLSLASASSEPEVRIIDTSARNAAALAQGDRSVLVMTSGLVDALDRVGLEAVVADVVVRLGSGDAEAATLAGALFGPLRQGPLRALMEPVAQFGTARLLGAERDLVADQAAVALTRYPPGLLTALAAVRSGPMRIEDAPPSFDHVWFVPPHSVGQPASPSTVTPLDLRIDVLGEL